MYVDRFVSSNSRERILCNLSEKMCDIYLQQILTVFLFSLGYFVENNVLYISSSQKRKGFVTALLVLLVFIVCLRLFNPRKQCLHTTVKRVLVSVAFTLKYDLSECFFEFLYSTLRITIMLGFQNNFIFPKLQDRVQDLRQRGI